MGAIVALPFILLGEILAEATDVCDKIAARLTGV